MAVTEFVAAIDISSTRMYGIVGKKTLDGSLQILAFNETSTSSFMKKGVIYNIEKATMAIKSVVEQLELQLRGRIEQIYVGINAQSMQSKLNTVELNFDAPTVIDQSHIDDITDINSNQLSLENNYKLISVYPQEYNIGVDSRDVPKGIKTSKPLVGNYVNIISNNKVIDNINSCFDNLEVELADLTPSHIAAAELLISNEEKEAGCAFVNFGAETTTISIYKNKKIRNLVVIPIGGNTLTRDLTSLKIIMDRAEDIKLRVGDVCYNEADENKQKTIYKAPNSSEELSYEDINNILSYRQNEIIQNVWNQIQKSKFANELNEGIIYTGGASKIRGLKEMIQSVTKFNKVKEATLQPLHVTHSEMIEKLIGQVDHNRMYMCYSMLLLAKNNCAPKVKGANRELFAEEELINNQNKDSDNILAESKRKAEEIAAADRELELRATREREQQIQKEKEEERKLNKQKKSFGAKMKNYLGEITDSWLKD